MEWALFALVNLIWIWLRRLKYNRQQWEAAIKFIYVEY